MPEIRLQKYIADKGICSRRQAEKLISDGKVKVNGRVVTKLGTKVSDGRDKVEVLGKGNIQQELGKVYIAINKPIDCITSTTSSQGKSVMELLVPGNYWKTGRPEIKYRVYPVGRLDKDSEGLLLLTNDGELANRLTHPRFEHQKEYEVMIDKALSRDARKVLSQGMVIDGQEVRGVVIKKEFKTGRRVIITAILQEGKNRQVRKMFGNLGYRVLSLRRVRMGKFKLGTLPIGKWRWVKKEQIV